MSSAVESRGRATRPDAATRAASHEATAVARSVVAGSALIGFGAAILVAWIAQGDSVGVIAAAAIAACVGVVAVLAIRQVARQNATAAEPVETTGLQKAAAPCVITDASGNIVDANQVFWRAFARSQPRRIDDVATLARDPDYAVRAFAELAEAASTDSASDLILIRQAENDRCYRVHVLRDIAPGGRLVWRFDDVTADRAEIIEAQAESAFYRSLLDRLPVGVAQVDGEGVLRFANAALAALLKRQETELLRWSDVANETLAAADADQPAMIDLRDDTGARRPAAYYEARLDDDEAIGGTVGAVLPRFLRDGEEASADKRFGSAVQHAPVGIALLDLEGTISYANAAFGRIAFQSEGEPGAERKLRGHRLADYIVEDGQVSVDAHLQGAIASRQAAEAVDVAWRAKQSMIVSMVFTPLVGEHGAVDAVLATVVDITTQRQLEQQFTQAQKMQAVGQLAGGVAHDFNNLLTAMIGFCDLLLARMVPGDQSYEDVLQILQNANRAANLVRQLLAFSRKQTLTPRVVNMTDTVAELGHMLRRLLGEGIELKTMYARDLWLVKADESQLQHVIINLAVNARDAMGGQGMLTIQTSNFPMTDPDERVHEAMPVGDYVCVSVTDTGHGIPKEIIDRIWEPFFTTKELGEGTGLGLSTCYGIIKQTGGFIFADSVKDEGSTFSIYLPRHIPEETKETAKEVAKPARDLTGVGRVLLVEDEDAVRLFSTRALKNKGYEVLSANGGEQALELLDEADNRIDLLITDVMMPEMDGPTLIKHVRERIPDIKAICISGYAEDAIRDRLADDTEIHFLAKPFNLEDLATMVKEVLSA